MLQSIFKKGFWVPYEDSTNFPTSAKAVEAIQKYCQENHHTCVFTEKDEVEIDGIRYGIYRGLLFGGRGNYGIKCKEK